MSRPSARPLLGEATRSGKTGELKSKALDSALTLVDGAETPEERGFCYNLTIQSPSLSLRRVRRLRGGTDIALALLTSLERGKELPQIFSESFWFLVDGIENF